jgi:endonuclease/exonuclease/phosphatase family metal-dependent hydrolase
MKRLCVLAFAVLLTSACSESGPLGVPEQGAALSRGPLPAGAEVNVLTRNLYVGGDISRVFGAADPIAAANEVWQEILHTNFPARAEHLAAEISRMRPDLVGLQEVIRFTVGEVTDPVFPSTPLLDFLAILQANLMVLGVEYDVAVRHANTRLAVPVLFPSGLMLVGLEQADAILVRRGVEVANSFGQTYAAFPPLELTAGFPLRRGWTQVDARVGGSWLRFVNTHLEIQPFAPVQEAQIAELIGHLAESPYPVILVGDFNSAANRNAPAESKTASYRTLLDAGFHDLWLAQDGVSNNSGPTCCQASDLSNRASELDQRLDLILTREVQYWRGVRKAAVQVEVFGHRPPDRFLTPDGYHLWPSDHAGVAAKLFIAEP